MILGLFIYRSTVFENKALKIVLASEREAET
jgi:hypothetical protein